jgi:uncharacterized secreted protein with C-terminal beta-propeller domain
VTVLRQDGARLEKVGAVGGLGHGQRIYGVRFMGARGFVVTFRQVDPLYTLDLADPTAPRVRGELEIPGYSAYLHPVGDTLLLGIGREGAGVQASLFDVSDMAAPKRVSQLAFGPGATPVESQPHAFLYWKGLAVVPFNGIAIALNAPPLTEAGRIAHPDGAPIERSLVIGDELYTVSYRGLGANRLSDLGPVGFTAF